jgi:hypothetical protein
MADNFLMGTPGSDQLAFKHSAFAMTTSVHDTFW